MGGGADPKTHNHAIPTNLQRAHGKKGERRGGREETTRSRKEGRGIGAGEGAERGTQRRRSPQE